MARVISPLLIWIASIMGCGGDARVQLAAADSVDLLRAGIAQSLAEYHADLAALDDQRRQAATDALIDRLRNDETDADASADAFRQAMQRLDADREVAWQRYAASMDTVSLMGEIAADLRRVAAESMALNDEAQRYFTDLARQYKERRVQEAAEKTEKQTAPRNSPTGPARMIAEQLLRSRTR